MLQALSASFNPTGISGPLIEGPTNLIAAKHGKPLRCAMASAMAMNVVPGQV
jgi:hypothetical protein